jgi:hypothetical protein
LANIEAARATWRGPRLLKYMGAFTTDGDETTEYKAIAALFDLMKPVSLRKRWLIARKERTVCSCPNMRDSSCCTSMQAADHDHALAT